jgi:hypothetical protein
VVFKDSLVGGSPTSQQIAAVTAYYERPATTTTTPAPVVTTPAPVITTIPDNFNYAEYVRPYAQGVIDRVGNNDVAYREIIQKAKEVVAQGYVRDRIIREIAFVVFKDSLVGGSPTSQQIAAVTAYYER